MPWNDDDLYLLQKEVRGRLHNDAFFSDIKVMLVREGIDVEKVAADIGPHSKRNGKTGACAIVLMPTVKGREGEAPGPLLNVEVNVQVIESREFNNLASVGTGKSAERIGSNVLNILDMYAPSFGSSVMTAAGKLPMRPYETGVDDWVSYLVTLDFPLALGRTAKVARPGVSFNGGEITLSCVTSGAAIYYTTDGEYPGPECDTATLYTVPFSPGPSSVLVAAYKADHIPSNPLAFELLV